MNVRLRPEKYLRYLYLPNLFTTKRTTEILTVNPTVEPHGEEAKEVHVHIFDFDAEHLEEKKLTSVKDCFRYKTSGRTTWINVDGLRNAEVEAICSNFDIHPLVIEDILSINQRPKLDEADNSIFCLLNMLYYRANGGATIRSKGPNLKRGRICPKFSGNPAA